MTTIKNRRAEEFDRALSAKRTTDPGMAALVAVAGALTAIPQSPAPAFRDSLRARLMAEAAQLAAAPVPAAPPAAAVPPPAASPLQGFAKVLAKPAMQVVTGGLAATIAAAGVGVGTHRALPGDRLYGLKRALAGNDATLTGGAEARINEIVALLERDGLAAVGRVEATLQDLRAELDALTAELLDQVRAGSRAAYDRLHAEVRRVGNLLQALRGQLPPEARDELDAAMGTVNTARAVLAALPLPGEPTTPLPTGPAVTPTPTGTKPPATPSPTPSSTPPNPPTTTPSTPPTGTPTISEPPVTVPPLPTVEPTLPTLPPLVP